MISFIKNLFSFEQTKQSKQTQFDIILTINIEQQTNQIVVKSNNIIFSKKKATILFNNNEITICNDENNDNSINILETKEKRN